ncbi:tetratricopeptide repeat protein [Plectonema radiosum NIES-515]|uniref:Tetratricopeptide repeat protein n=1 Tax=Plectonema radiosum NIES-515 TaxID=2986073 RepID=A0ABT3B0G6_9CYAN|nr:tetratricopeptide repeat protein [Plectonema radiosum]MCV3214864.1 tetratricopeptide repeat protein [Plectonema radiosum NIES-515]
MNNPQKKPKSLQDILQQRQQSGFVGREEQVSLFRQNLDLSLEDSRRHFLFNVWGQGGVGKSTLLRQFRKIAEEAKIIAAHTDDSEKSVSEAMGRLAEQLEQQNHKLTQFSDRYKVYRQKRQELESDPEAPQGFSAFVGKTVAKTGVLLARRVPVGGAVFDFIDEDAVASQAGEWASYVAKKLTNKDEVRLIQEPVEVLTPLFLQDISKLAEKSGVALFFDTYESTEDFLDNWLREILEGRYGEVPLNILVIIAGRQELDKNHWAPYEGLMIRFPLEPFTEEEAQQYLTRKGITNSRVIEVILRLSGRLPLLVATLAAESPNDPSQVGDPSGTAVERFLKWIDDPKRRQLALDAAIPRCLNRDVLAKLRGEDEADELFNWLKEMPFIEERTDGWAYHEVVKTQMLRHKRLSSPQSWADLHGKLGEYYDTLRNNLQLNEEKKQGDPTWQSYALNVLYHSLCQTPQKSLSIALNNFLPAFDNERSFALRWAETTAQAGKNVDNAEVQRWGEQLVNGLKAYEEDCYEVAVEMFTALLEHSEIQSQWRTIALSRRGNIYRSMKRYEEALKDFDCAIQLNPKYYWAIAGRGETYRLMKRYEEALKNFDQAIQLNHKYDYAIANRGYTYRLIERYEEALKDFDCAIELNPKYDWAIAHRGKTYRSMKRYEEALKDFDCAIELNPKLDWTIANRGYTYRLMERYEEALKDFDCAIELNPKYDWAIAHRGKTYRSMKRYEEALKDFDQAIELNPKSQWAIALRGYAYLMLKRYNEALENLNCAINLKPDNNWYLYSRALAYQALNQVDKARVDLNNATKLAQQNYQKDAKDWGNTLNLALYYLIGGNVELSQRLYQYALSSHASLERMRAAIRDLEDFSTIFPEYIEAQSMRKFLQSSVT